MSVIARLVLTILLSLCMAFSQPPNTALSQAIRLDLTGKGAEARAFFQQAIDSAATPAAKAQAWRAMAMSWAFEGNCAKTLNMNRWSSTIG